MKTKDALGRLEGVQTIGSIMSVMGVNRARAIYLVHRLRNGGYVRTRMGPGRKRVYDISFGNKLGGTSYYEIINRHSPIKLLEPETYKIYGREVSLEETLVFAIKSRKIRLILASLALFKSINNWSLLYRLVKANNAGRKAGALYDLSKKIMRVRRMDGRISRLLMPSKGQKYEYIVEGLGSKDFRKIEDKWKVYIPFNMADLEDYT